jgi:hypothetical protein
MRPKRIFVGAAMLGLLAVGTAAIAASPTRPTRPRAVPRPPFASLAAATRAEMLRYAEALSFDTSVLASDSRRLMLRAKGQLAAGPTATLSPEIGATTMTVAEMHEGRILARIVLDEAMPLQGYAKGANYIWVDRARGYLRAVIIPGDRSVPTREFGFQVKHERINAPGTNAEARFRWNEVAKGETIWVRCSLGCCQVQSDEGSQRPKIPKVSGISSQ